MDTQQKNIVKAFKIVESIPDDVSTLIDEDRKTLDTFTADNALLLKVMKAVLEGSIVLFELEDLEPSTLRE